MKIYFYIVAFWKHHYFMFRPLVHLGLKLHILWDWNQYLFFLDGHPILSPTLTSPSCCQYKVLALF